LPPERVHRAVAFERPFLLAPIFMLSGIGWEDRHTEERSDLTSFLLLIQNEESRTKIGATT
jgi:hypothetical protein